MKDIPRTIGIGEHKPMDADAFRKFGDQLESMKVKRKGFIMMPDFDGFKLYEIDEQRLKQYLAMETLHRQSQEFPECENCNGVGRIMLMIGGRPRLCPDCNGSGKNQNSLTT